jgi:spore photoproduct lyase
MDTIYVESGVRSHPRAKEVLKRHPKATVIECDHYGEIFNVKSQNFKLQKQRPSLILAEKKGQTVLPAPPDYSIGPEHNFYFSHMLNCLYDCRYCFLQGMYRSANYLFFVNFEAFESDIEATREAVDGSLCLFSGYDCDSLAMESLTGFAEHFVPWFSARPELNLELRTKSINTRILEASDPVPNIIPAFTLSPDPIAKEIEHGAPALERRLNRVRSLTQQGWMVGLRLDPLVPWPGFQDLYAEMITSLFREIDPEKIHSVTLGPMRFPKAMHDRIVKLYPTDPLFALEEMTLQNGQMTYPESVESELVGTVLSQLEKHLSRSRIFHQTA